MGLYLIKKYKENMKEKQFKKKYLNKQFIGYKIKDKKMISYYLEFKNGDFHLYENKKLLYSINKFSKVKEIIKENNIISELNKE